MLLQEPRPTGYELRFRIFGIPVSVHPFFWALGLLVFGQQATIVNEHNNVKADGNILLTLGICILVFFVSILVHELGHSLAMAYYGIRSRISLYMMGGLAIPENVARGRSKFNRWSQVHISFAGPLAQLVLFGLLVFAARLFHLETVFHKSFPFYSLQPMDGFKLSFLKINVYPVFAVAMRVNFIWAILNLLPILPLDGGRITQEILVMQTGPRGNETALWVTVACCIGVGLLAITSGHTFGAIFLGYFGFQAYQQLQGQQGMRF